MLDKKWQSKMARVYDLLRQFLDRHPEEKERVQQFARILGQIDGLYQAQGLTRPKPVQKRPRRNRPRQYQIVERIRGGAFLLEERQDGQQPFLVAEKVYEAVARAFAEFKEPRPFEELLRKANDYSGETLPDYLPRTCLRFWLWCQPPLARKDRARYAPGAPGRQFEAAAKLAWQELSKISQ